ncbi:MAG TPA: hypothetical protein VJS12_10180 [Steroidobacteraceae bacterium]|nr:hypothetical protein [Steroidobacteraceae bacterium]
MDRAVIVGGSLMAASFLVAVVLNRSAHQEAVPVEAVRQPPARICVETGRRAPGTIPAREADEKCTPAPADPEPR